MPVVIIEHHCMVLVVCGDCHQCLLYSLVPVVSVESHWYLWSVMIVSWCLWSMVTVI